MTRKMFVGVALTSATVWMAAAAVDATVLCQKKSGAVFARDTACKKKETPLDATSLLGTLPTRLTALESSVITLQSDVSSLDDIREVQSLTGLAALTSFTHDADLASLSFTNTHSGHARISVTISASATCAGGLPFGVFYLTLDGVDIADSGGAIPDTGTLYPLRLVGTTAAVVDPGTHTVQVALDCLSGGSGYAYAPYIDGDVTIIRVTS